MVYLHIADRLEDAMTRPDPQQQAAEELVRTAHRAQAAVTPLEDAANGVADENTRAAALGHVEEAQTAVAALCRLAEQHEKRLTADEG